MSTPPSSVAGAASMTRLPPSPETTFLIPPGGALPKHLSLHDDAAVVDGITPNGSRLRSISRYGKFHPQAIACSTPLVTHYTNEQDSEAKKTPGDGNKDESQQEHHRSGTSVAAIAGPQGVALFQVSRPHTPLVVLSHASSRNSAASSVSALSFQPHTKDSLLLAAARGNGILIWDASGHCLSPLLGRLSMEPTLSTSDRITSLSWKDSTEQSLLATTNETNACLWDLRTALRANSSRPSVRLGASRKVGRGGSVVDCLVQIAVSSKNEVATLDATGMVHVFDVRMTDRSPKNVGEVSGFSSFHHAGIGLESLPTTCNEGTRWVTWGLDAPQSDAIVKVWSDGAVASSGRNDGDAESYWYMDSSPTSSPKTSTAMSEASSKSAQMQYRQIAEFSTPYLACARVCPDPFENKIVTVGMIPGRHAGIITTAWQAETWQLKKTMDDNSVDGNHRGVDKIASFGILNDSETASMVGTNTATGQLRGAELALEPSQALFGRQKGGKGYEGDGVDLLLCCLSDNGYVTTHTVFETRSRTLHGRKEEETTGSQESPRREQGEGSFTYSDRTKVYQSDARPGRDAASMFRVGRDPDEVGGIDAADSLFQGGFLEQLGSGSPLRRDLDYLGSDGNLLSSGESHPNDGMTTQFDMDVPVAYGAPVPGQRGNNMAVLDVASPPVVLLSNDDDAIEVDLERKSIAARIDKNKVPCPRLCGGSFSPGIGGIVCFNNGEVRKMWSWYKQSDPGRLLNMSEGKGRSLSSQQSNTSDSNSKQDHSEPGDSSVFTSEPQENLVNRRQEMPRTLKDLEDMTDHARFSQWRSDESSGGESSIDDQSDESLDGFASGDEDDLDARKRMYEKYFGTSPQSLLESPSPKVEKDHNGESTSSPRSPSRQKQTATVSLKSNENAAASAFAGPSSDLVPAVYITHDHDSIVFCGQSKELAVGWTLGKWDSLDSEEAIPSPSPRGLPETESLHSQSRDTFGLRDADEGMALPRPQSAELPLRSHDDRMHRVRSDPMLIQPPPAPQQINKYGVGSDEDPVHAGAYSKRPNRNESMVFLKKLVSHQRGDAQPMQSLMSPPDSPMLPNRMSLNRKKRSASAGGIVQTPSPTSVAVNESEFEDSNRNIISLGVYTLADERGPQSLTKVRDQKLREACVHNAGVCVDLGQDEKANTWNLLSQMAENVLEDEHDNFNGWGGPYGGSLGHDLVSKMLTYYEGQGDVQMLATMVCVLGGDQRTKVADGCSLLPVSHQDRYDGYIRQYADLLYRWRLMSERAELCKYLGRQLPDAAGGNDQYAIVDTNVWCKIHRKVTTDNGICRQCRNYAFRCSICDIAVRGLFTLCGRCGHGGHTSHLTEWFNKHSVCPTGCGCSCLLVAPMQMDNINQNIALPQLLTDGQDPVPMRRKSGSPRAQGK